MRKPNLLSVTTILVLVLAATITRADNTPPAVGALMPDITLTAPASPDQRAYLGLSKEGPFTLKEITAPVIIVEIFSMYCPYCQAEAPHVNELYEAIKQDPQLSGKVVILGIGAGNTAFEVNIFKEKYQIPFPLFDDEDYAIHKIVGKVRTPYFIVAKGKPNSTRGVIYSKAGALEDIEGFKAMLRWATGK